ncbi:GRB2-related adapter protein 2 [Holothuria leucospilota]|uniref:GRB2-related adapter protein 2 n=1 Tax=Holothuria leucospilota TaxID=206669 RepID=A0A9Q1BD08_HOLLE|nr:GRB2-related adapter protein 2 [Holothuria leucospilota]
MDLKETFRKDWRNAFSNAPLPDLSCLRTGDTWESLIEDELDLERKQKEAQQALDQIVFCVKWVKEKKEEIERLIPDDQDIDYANWIHPAESEDRYYNVHEQRTPKFSDIGRSQTEPVLPIQRSSQKEDFQLRRPPQAAPRSSVKARNSLKQTLSVESPVSSEQSTTTRADMNSEVSDENLRILSSKIADSFLHFGSRTLGFTQNELEMCQSMSDDESKQALRMLLKWKRRLGHLATTSNLLGLLQKEGYGSSVWGFLADNEEPSQSTSESTDKSKDFEPYQTCVIKDYNSKSPDEISIKKGDFIKIQDKGKIGWYYGYVRGKGGWIPKNCIGEEESTKRLLFRFRVQTSTECDLRSRVGNVKCPTGEDLDVIEETSILSRLCYRVRNKDGLVGVVSADKCRKVSQSNPILWERDWFHQDLSRREAENKLNPCSRGTFLIRDASNMPGNFVLSVRTKEDVANFMISCHSYGYTAYNHEFSSLQEIIDYFKKNVIRDGLFLKSPV